MERAELSKDGELFQEGGFWMLRRHDGAKDLEHCGLRPGYLPCFLGPAGGPAALTEEQARQVAWENVFPELNRGVQAHAASMTVARFVETRFIPEHVETKGASGRTHYKAILKHVLRPEEVDRVFGASSGNPRVKLRAVPDWPYLGATRLCDVQPDHVRQLLAAALQRGYSTQTATHIRNVISAIFSHAARQRCFIGVNPASRVALPEAMRKESRGLSLTQMKQVLEVMQSPEKEMTLIAILTGMNVSEICGLQWKHVNLAEEESLAAGHPVPPRSIAVRDQWYRGKLCGVMKGRNRNLPISGPLESILMGIRRRSSFVSAADFVLTSRVGTPINQANVVARKLKPMGRELEMPWLSLRALCRTHKELAAEFGARLHDYMAAVVPSCFSTESETSERWHCRKLLNRSFEH